MKCRFFTAIVLAVAMLVSFGLCNLSVAANSTSKHFEESGTVYNNAMGVHTQLGTYHNWIDEANEPFAIAYYGETYPAPGLYGTTTYETYTTVYVTNDDGSITSRPLTITDDIVVDGESGMEAVVRGYDGHTAYEQMEDIDPYAYFYYRFTNEITSYNNGEYYGSRSKTGTFSFDGDGSLN